MNTGKLKYVIYSLKEETNENAIALESQTSENESWQKGDPIVEPQGLFKTAGGKLILTRQCP